MPGEKLLWDFLLNLAASLPSAFSAGGGHGPMAVGTQGPGDAKGSACQSRTNCAAHLGFPRTLARGLQSFMEEL